MIQVNNQDLKKALDRLMLALDKDVHKVLNYVLIEKKNKYLQFRMSNYKFDIVEAIASRGKLKKSILVDFLQLHKMITENQQSEFLSFDVNDNDNLYIKDHLNLETEITTTMNSNEYISSKELSRGKKDKHNFMIDRWNLKTLLKSVYSFRGKNDRRDHLNNIGVKIKDNIITAYACDGIIIARQHIHITTSDFFETEFMLSPEITKALIDLLSNKPYLHNSQVYITIDNSYHCIKFEFLDIDCSDQTMIVSKLEETKTPDYERVIPLTLNNSITLNRSEMINAVKNLNASLKVKNSTSYLDVSTGIVNIHVKNKKASSNTFKVPTTDNLTLDYVSMLNSKYLLKALRGFGNKKINIAFNQEQTPKMFYSDKDTLIICVMPLMRED